MILLKIIKLILSGVVVKLSEAFFGKEATLLGICDLLVSWTTNQEEHWDLGKDWLYFN